ncbi:hypothetical protein LOTGIDRAFT_163562 [Lottia gigantea]|uniref:SRCR domain-containing protein n=1 Tax=Lottia gigantea TaxID=225164 RepID=V4BQ89_LOTGI|nr:hypothetical protein LOTGIDRAFT_163562 [Lottia gigantea]ESO91044.1 hypothetical protein LOTGIDRAFT_163562 [Lottia gigantea]
MRWWMYLCLVCSLWINFTDAVSVRLAGGGPTYGYVEQNIGGVWKPVCPGENDETQNLAPAVCQSLGFEDGSGYKMTTPVTALEWWYNEFTRSDQASVIPSLDAYATRKWISASRTSQYEHCQSSTLAVLCTGKVQLNIASSYLKPSLSERGFGRVVLSPPNKNSGYIDPSAIDATGARIICKELGFNTSSQISDDQVVGSTQDVNTYVTDKYTCAGTEDTILDCPTSPVTNPSYKPAVVACTNSDISDGTVKISEHQSLVEIRYNDAWGLICGDSFTDIDAVVVCKSLGFNNGKASKVESYRVNRLYPVWIKSLNCVSGNTKPVECNKDMWDTRCNNVAQAQCFNTETAGVYTFTDGGKSVGNHFIERSSKNEKGILAIQLDKRQSDNEPAPKLCKSLGYTSGNDFHLPGSSSLPQGKYWLAVYTKSVGECITTDECFKNDWTLTEDLSKVQDYVKLIICHNGVYLSGNGLSGIVNYKASDASQPSTVNDATLDSDEVNLICKDLGFPDGGRKISEKIFETQNAGGMVNMDCTSGATNTSSCTFSTIADTSSLVPAVLACNLPANLPDIIYLDNDGVVIYNKNNNPVQFCVDDKEWTDKEASVACRQLGYSASNYYKKSRDSNTAVGYKSVTCLGNEQLISECQLVETTSGECSKVAAVTCYNPDDTKFELRDGGDRFGRVWVTRGNQQGYFCYEKFDEEDAGTICRELGFKGGDEIKMTPVTASGTTWWYVNTNCDDDTKVIEGCEVQLEEAPFISYGAVRQTETEIRYSSDSFDATEANIACHEMGYPQGGKVIPSSSFEVEDDPIIVNCAGSETSLMDCQEIAGTKDDTKFASIACETGETIPEIITPAIKDKPKNLLVSFAEGTLKIIDDFRVLIVKNGVWGGLCADSWTDNDATVVCKQLKGATSGKSLKRGNKLNVKYTNFKEAWNCAGTEASLENCPVDQSITEKYCRESAGVYCNNHQPEASSEETYPDLPGFTFAPEDESSTTPLSTQGNNAASTPDDQNVQSEQPTSRPSEDETFISSTQDDNTANTPGITFKLMFAPTLLL